MFDADVVASRGASRWSVAECGWKKLLPDLPDDVIALLADPVVVSARALTRAPATTVERTAPDANGYGETTPRFLAPAPPRARRVRHRG
jgi:hypothetical protein